MYDNQLVVGQAYRISGALIKEDNYNETKAENLSRHTINFTPLSKFVHIRKGVNIIPRNYGSFLSVSELL